MATLNSLTAARPTWLLDEHAKPACAGRPPEWWFPKEGENGTRAKLVCADCPLLAPCREYAIPLVELQGVWGGLSNLERAAERRARGGTCLCGHDAVEHLLRWRSGIRGRCKECACDEHLDGSGG